MKISSKKDDHMNLASKQIALIFVAMFLMPRFLLADIPPDLHRRNMDITTNPGALIFGSLPLRFSFAVAPRVALGIGASGKFFGYGHNSVLGFGGSLDAKFFLSGHAYESSWYVKPGIALGTLSIGNDQGLSFGGFVSGGYGWVWPSGFTLDLGLGLQYIHWFHGYAGGFGTDGILPHLDLNLGFAC